MFGPLTDKVNERIAKRIHGICWKGNVPPDNYAEVIVAIVSEETGKIYRVSTGIERAINRIEKECTFFGVMDQDCQKALKILREEVTDV